VFLFVYWWGPGVCSLSDLGLQIDASTTEDGAKVELRLGSVPAWSATCPDCCWFSAFVSGVVSLSHSFLGGDCFMCVKLGPYGVLDDM
jgi:hypothetical protein